MQTIKVSDITDGMPTLQQQVDSINLYRKAYANRYSDDPDPHLELLNRRCRQIEDFVDKCRKYGINPEIRL